MFKNLQNFDKFNNLNSLIEGGYDNPQSLI